MYKYKGGKKELLSLIFQGYSIRFDKISNFIITYERYIRKDSISVNTYFFDNIYNWSSKKECKQALERIEEYFDYIGRQ